MTKVPEVNWTARPLPGIVFVGIGVVAGVLGSKSAGRKKLEAVGPVMGMVVEERTGAGEIVVMMDEHGWVSEGAVWASV